MVLLEGLGRVMQHRAQLRHGRGRRLQDVELTGVDARIGISGTEDSGGMVTGLHLQVAQEKQVISGLFDALIFYSEEKYSECRVTHVMDMVVLPEADTIEVHDPSSIGITESTFYPVQARIGDEVVMITGIRRSGRLEIQRSKHRAKKHVSGLIISAVMRLSGEPTSYGVKVKLANKLKVKIDSLAADIRPCAGHESLFDCAFTVFATSSKESDDLRALLNDVCIEWTKVTKALSPPRFSHIIGALHISFCHPPLESAMLGHRTCMQSACASGFSLNRHLSPATSQEIIEAKFRLEKLVEKIKVTEHSPRISVQCIIPNRCPS